MEALLRRADAQLAAIVGVQAEAVSSSAIRVSWTDPNNVFNPAYTVQYTR